MYVLGLDLGTQGARALIVDLDGRVRAEAERAFDPRPDADLPPGHFEQDPAQWRDAVYAVLAEAVARLRDAGDSPAEIAALSVTSTSGTLCLVDAAGEPVGPAIMYSDTRAGSEADAVQAAGTELADRLSLGFNASFGLCKAVWVARHQPERLARARWLLSPTDAVIGWLSGTWGISDWTNMLKTGYDVERLSWPAFISDELGLPSEKLPHVVAPGQAVGRISAATAAATGLSTDTRVVAGATDGTASQLASGAVAPGDWNSTLGTTLVLKGVSAALLRDPQGRIYCHRHPDGYWLPGGASSTGADCLAQRFPSDRLATLNEAAMTAAPTDLIVYPLMRRGERFPFLRPEAAGFQIGEAPDEATWFLAHLEGLAYVERLAYDVVENLGAPVGDTIYVAGGAVRGVAALQVRADVLGRRLEVPRVPAGAMGAAILAARAVAFDSVAAAARAMVHPDHVVAPRPERAAAYQTRYERFLAACRERGYLA